MVVHQNITNLAGYFHFLNVRKIPYVIMPVLLDQLWPVCGQGSIRCNVWLHYTAASRGCSTRLLHTWEWGGSVLREAVATIPGINVPQLFNSSSAYPHIIHGVSHVGQSVCSPVLPPASRPLPRIATTCRSCGCTNIHNSGRGQQHVICPCRDLSFPPPERG